MGYSIGIDVGGTLTDCAAVGADGTVRAGKVPTEDDEAGGVLAGTEALAHEFGQEAKDFLRETELIVALLPSPTRCWNTTVLKLASSRPKGFPDVIELRRGCQKACSTVVWKVRNQEGDIIFMQSGGGGGWGPAWDRDPQLVGNDVKNELVSLEAAKLQYGVVLDEQAMNLDTVRTQSLRATRGMES